jgi:pilus assembly protein CpaB
MQNRRGLIFIVLALAMGIAAAYITTQLAPTSATAEVSSVVDMTPVVVLRSDVPVASILAKEHIKTIEWPVDHVPGGALRSVDQAIGRVVRRPIAAGETLTEIALFAKGAAGGLSSVITTNYRAVSVKVDNVIGVAGFVTPGSRVDVMATIRRIDLPKALPFAKVILQDVRVLAVDQKLEEVRTGDPELVSVVTLEVDPLQAEHLIYAAHEGRLQLALRSPGDNKEVETKSIGVADVLGEARPGRALNSGIAPTQTVVELIHGSQVQIKKF